MAVNTEILIQAYAVQVKKGKDIETVPLIFRSEVLKIITE